MSFGSNGPAGHYGSFNMGGSSSSSSSSVTAGGLASVLPSMALGRPGGKIVKTGDSLELGNGGTEYSISQPLEAKIAETFRRTGWAQPTYSQLAAGGNTSSDIWFGVAGSALAAIIAALGADGQDLISNGTINDILGLAGHNGLGPFTQSQTIQNIRTGIKGVLQTYPNTRIWLLGPVWATSETYTIDPLLGPVGNNALDGAIRSMDTALAALAKEFPNNVRYVSLYYYVYRYAVAANPTNLNAVMTQGGGPHPSMLGVRAIGDACISQIPIAGYDSPASLVVPSRTELTSLGDAYEEAKSFMLRHKSGGGGIVAPNSTNVGVLNRFKRLPIPGPPPAGFTDPGILGGAWRFSGAGTGLISQLGYPNPKTMNFAAWIRAAFSAAGTGKRAYVGLGSSDATQEAYLIGIDSSQSTVNWVRNETDGGTALTFASTTAAITTPVDIYLFHQLSDNGNNILDVVVANAAAGGAGGIQIFDVNPSLRFPQQPCGLVAALCLGGATVDVIDGCYGWFE